ncbi:MAG TPA: hypothetical protein VGU20_21470 [Stellaceae bacterium]|nr:hypothetical protein [Stellaceae bacterium]
MATQRTFHRFLAMSVAAAVLLMPITPRALAAQIVEAPFGTAPQVADATLDTMRGGFAKDGAKVPFGLEVKFESAANHKDIASFDITNHGDKNQNVQVTENGFTVTQTGLSSTTTVGPGQTVTTNVTNKGVITIIQSNTSNSTLQTAQRLSISITGMNMKDFVRTTGLNALHNSRVLFH